MECYICFEEYTTKSGIPCIQCKKSCCGNCWMKQYINDRATPKCGLCRFDPQNIVSSLFIMEKIVGIQARELGFNIDEAIEFKKQVQEMRKK